ncbi:MAG: hypothetical protein NTV77_03855, partial [Candidatus Azambacteria bacterium]|nr:hypothetical protein [Candidatus Azambacteria bacterium]
MRTGGRGKHNFFIGGAFRKAKYEIRRQLKKIGIGISPKQKEEQAEDSSPDPSSSACDIRIQKKGISRSFAES